MKKIKNILAAIIFWLLIVPQFIQIRGSAIQSKMISFEAVVAEIIEEKPVKPTGAKDYQLYQKLKLIITSGENKNKKIIVENGNLPVVNLQKYTVGDRLVINSIKDIEGKDSYYIADYVRRGALFWLLILFIILTVIIGSWQGAFSFLGMGLSFSVIFIFILPQILAGSDPVTVVITGAFIIIPVTFLLSHGVNKKTIIAIGGTLISLVMTGILANIFVQAARLTGFATEEAGFLLTYRPGAINMKGLLLAGIIIGVLGVLDDITVSQSAIVEQLHQANPQLSLNDLYKKAMAVGRDHIASMVNTLILVYTGAALPLLLLFVNNPQPFSQIINYEIIADEIVRTLVGSIGLIIAVPITTAIAVLAIGKTR